MRDEDGNVIDIIIDGEEDEEDKDEDNRWGKPLNPEEDGFEKAPVQAKTQVVRGEYEVAAFPGQYGQRLKGIDQLCE